MPEDLSIYGEDEWLPCLEFKKLDIHSNPVNLNIGGRACRVSLWRDSETGGNRLLVRSCKIPHWGVIRENQANIPLGSLNEAGTLLDSNKRYRQEAPCLSKRRMSPGGNIT